MKSLYIIFALLCAWVNAQCEINLSEIWPEGAREGKFDDLGCRYQIDRRLVLVPGANWCLIEGEMTRLLTPAWPNGNNWDLPSELVKKLEIKGWITKKNQPIQPSINKRSIVVLDAGHGGKDPGAIGLGGTMEKDVALDVTLRVKKMLLNKGVIVK